MNHTNSLMAVVYDQTTLNLNSKDNDAVLKLLYVTDSHHSQDFAFEAFLHMWNKLWWISTVSADGTDQET